jgi:hypothetical protein
MEEADTTADGMAADIMDGRGTAVGVVVVDTTTEAHIGMGVHIMTIPILTMDTRMGSHLALADTGGIIITTGIGRAGRWSSAMERHTSS